MKPRLLSLCPIADSAAKARIQAVYDVTEQKLTEASEVASAIAPYEAVIVPFTSNLLVDQAAIDAAPNLRLIASTYGGTRQNIADEYALGKGITVIHTGASRERPMAEYTLGLVLASLLRIASYHADMTLGGEAWPRLKYPRTRILHDRSVAVIGYGRIGKAILDLFRFFTDKLAVVSKHLTEAEAAAAGLVKQDLDTAFASDEVLILAGGSNAETHHQVGRRQFELMREGALFVNIARGKMVDQAAMIEVASRRDIFLALDVFETEPLEADSPLRTMSNALITPHRANNSIEFEERWECLASQIEDFAQGKTPESALTIERARVMSES